MPRSSSPINWQWEPDNIPNLPGVVNGWADRRSIGLRRPATPPSASRHYFINHQPPALVPPISGCRCSGSRHLFQNRPLWHSVPDVRPSVTPFKPAAPASGSRRSPLAKYRAGGEIGAPMASLKERNINDPPGPAQGSNRRAGIRLDGPVGRREKAPVSTVSLKAIRPRRAPESEAAKPRRSRSPRSGQAEGPGQPGR
jgi:hypothetical protein